MKVRGKIDVVGNIIAVREKHQVHAAQLFNALYERRGEARGIHQHISSPLRRTQRLARRRL